MVYSQLVFSNTTTESSPMFTMGSKYVAKAKILKAHIPMSFDPTGSQSNSVAIRENGTVRIVQIKPGFYTAATFPAALQTALGGDYTVTYDEIKRNVVITNPNVSFSILPLSGGTTAFAQIGKGRDNESTAGNSWQGEAVSNFTGTNSLLLVCSELVSREFIVAGSNVAALALIELDAQPGSYMTWENNGDWLEVGSNLSFARFRWLDARTLQEIDFRGASWSLQIGILSDDDDQVTY